MSVKSRLTRGWTFHMSNDLGTGRLGSRVGFVEAMPARARRLKMAVSFILEARLRSGWFNERGSGCSRVRDRQAMRVEICILR